MNIELEKLSTDLAIRAQALTVTDQASANRATELVLAGKELVRQIKTFFAPLKDSAWATHKALVEKEKAELARVEPVVSRISDLITAWRVAEERKRREAEEATRRAEEERQRLEAEALRKVKEAEEKAERDRLRLEREAEELKRKELEALKTEDKAALAKIEERREEIHQEAQAILAKVEEATDNAIDEAAKAEVAMAPAAAIPETPKTTGLAMRDNWCYDVVYPMAIPREYLAVDEVKLGKVVRAVKGQIVIPGVRIFNKPYMAEIGKRIN